MTNSNITSNTPYAKRTLSTRATFAARLLGRAISAYRYARAGRISPCRFYPSCSQYALEAVEAHGALRGAWMATRRVLRCNPFGSHGVDLVPATREKRSEP